MSGKCQHRISPATAGPLTGPTSCGPSRPPYDITVLRDRQCPDRLARRGCASKHLNRLLQTSPLLTFLNSRGSSCYLGHTSQDTFTQFQPDLAAQGGPSEPPANQVPWKRSLNMVRGVRTALTPTCAGPSGVKAEPYLQGCSDLLAHPQVTEFTESSQESRPAKESCESNSHRQLFFLTEIQPGALKQQAHIRKCVKKESHDSDIWNSNEAPSEWKGGGDRGLRWQPRAGV